MSPYRRHERLHVRLREVNLNLRKQKRLTDSEAKFMMIRHLLLQFNYIHWQIGFCWIGYLPFCFL